MNEIEKMFNRVGLLGIAEQNPSTGEIIGCKPMPFTVEKQLEIENVILQNKKNYNKWIEYNINVYGEWVIRFVRTDKFAPYIALGKTRAEALARLINKLWADMSDEEKQQVKGILE